jgi:hypothetical protein
MRIIWRLVCGNPEKTFTIMATEKVIYTDGRDVVVTDSMFKVKNHAYRLNGITKLCMWTIRPDRWPSVILLLVGIAAAVLGYLGFLPTSWMLDTDYGTFSANQMTLWAGALLITVGILALILSKERYAVRIGTAEGERNAIVSYRKDYIANIVDAIHSAFDMHHPDHQLGLK